MAIRTCKDCNMSAEDGAEFGINQSKHGNKIYRYQNCRCKVCVKILYAKSKAIRDARSPLPKHERIEPIRNNIAAYFNNY